MIRGELVRDFVGSKISALDRALNVTAKRKAFCFLEVTAPTTIVD
jgi:hypothetical protein